MTIEPTTVTRMTTSPSWKGHLRSSFKKICILKVHRVLPLMDSVQPTRRGFVLQNQSPSVVYVGVVLPKKVLSGVHTFELCLASQCISAGQVATFGAGSSTSSQRVDSSTHMVVEYDVTDLVESSGWSGLELTARLTSSVVAGLPGPVVIERFGGSSGGEVTLAPGDELADYGNLLEKYDIVSDMES